jgi:hypothetical protein
MFQNVNESIEMTELTEDELTVVAGSGGLGFDGACGVCGFGFGPFITAFSQQNAVNFAAQTSVQFSQVHQTAFFTEFQ